MDIQVLLQTAIENNASDLHLVTGAPPIMRVHGKLRSQDGLFPVLEPEVIGDIFRSITSESQQKAFSSNPELDFAYSLPGIGRFRVNAALQRGSIALAFRCLPYEVPSIDELGLPEVCKRWMLKRSGLVLVTGPTGCGKSTTLAAMIDYLNGKESRRVVTIEDPIEFLFRHKKCLITQRELGSDTTSFALALRHTLRQDPEVVMVGEMRDLETMAVAITAAETGHLVLSTLHTVGAAESLERMIDVFPAYQQAQIRTQLALTLEGVLSQLLLPRADGLGRVPVFEVMLTTSAIRNLIRENRTHQILNYIQLGTELGMQTLDQSLYELVKKGAVTLEEALMRAQDPAELAKMVRQGATR